MNRIAIVVLKIFLLTLAITRTAQAAQSTPESPDIRGRMAMDRGNYTEAISIFSEALAQRPTADMFLNLGDAYRRNRDWEEAKKTLNQGENQFPGDSRISEALAHVYLEDGDVDSARNALLRALRIDPANLEAANQIADIEFSEGEVQTALRFWNRSGRPIVNRVLHNSNISFGNWTVAKAQTFQPGKMMTYSQWRTTELRLLETNIYSNVAVNIEPAPVSGRYNPIILTSGRSNGLSNVAVGLLRAAPLETSHLDWWNISNSGITLNSSYRWDYNRKRGDLLLHAPLPLPGVVFLSASAAWRSERWDLSRVLRTDAGSNSRFQFNSTSFRVELKYIPQFRFEFGGGFEYANRAANGGLTPLLINGRNSGKVIAESSIRISDSNRYRNRIHVEGFVARKGLPGDLNYSAATVEMNNQVQLSKRTRTVFDWTLKAGMSRGLLPVEDYFTLGVDTHSTNLLRAHPEARQGHYGNSPMGTSFALTNMRIERGVAVLPFFNTLNLPYLLVKVEAFLDSGETHDRARIFKDGKLYVDTGAGLKFATPQSSLNLIYGKSLREGWNVFTAYIEKHW